MVCFFAPCSGAITKVNTMQEIASYLEIADYETLVIFDVDMVLVQPSEPAFQMPNMIRHRSAAKRISQTIPPGKKELFLTLMLLGSDSILIDPTTPCLIHNLKESGIPTIALTANLTGPLGNIPSLDWWKVKRLSALGIDFAPSAPLKTNLTLGGLPSYRGHYSSYLQGVLFANGSVCPKGDVLVHFLNLAHFHPTRVIFIDDKEENLKNVEAALLNYDPNIEYEGIQYLGANHYPSTEITEKEFEAKWSALAESLHQID